ncbi:MAG: zinc ribbon domain-containing protein [Ruminococcus sp.]|nr:zinc ribbon domain-containing protein [Ruminococcus sp.]
MIIGLGICFIFIGVIALISAEDTISQFPAHDHLSGLYDNYVADYHNAVILRNVSIVLIITGILLIVLGYFISKVENRPLQKVSGKSCVCLKCGAMASAKQRYCDNCGNNLLAQRSHDTDVGAVCSQCGMPIKGRSNFCPHCGYVVSDKNDL